MKSRLQFIKSRIKEVNYLIRVFHQETAYMDSLCEVYGDWPERKADEKRALEKLKAEKRELEEELRKL